MKRVFLLVGAVALIVTSIGCAGNKCKNCNQCGNGGCGPGGCFAGRGGHFGGGAGGGGPGGPGGAYAGGPPTPTVVYPYYTTRGPRDFLDANPRSIGP